MKLTKIALSKLKTPEKNVRIHSEKQIREFKRSLEMFDQIRPIVVDENYTILAGNGLYTALTSLGRTEADCYVVSGLSDKEKKKLMLADNKIYSLGVDDMGVFEELINELAGDTDIPGYDPELLETLTADTDFVDDIMSGYGIVSQETKNQIQTTAQKYEAADTVYAEEAEEIKPAPQPVVNTSTVETPTAPAPEKLERRFIVCPKCGERIWL